MDAPQQSPLLYAQIALALAGFEMPQQEPDDEGQVGDFEIVHEAGDALELSVTFVAAMAAFDLEVRLPPGSSSAAQRAGLLLARTVDGLRCSIEPLNERFCLTRRIPWLSTLPVEDFAALAAELVTVGAQLGQVDEGAPLHTGGLSGPGLAAMRA